MTGWIAAVALYALGAVEVYMVRRAIPFGGKTVAVGTIFWPLFVPLAFVPERWYRR